MENKVGYQKSPTEREDDVDERRSTSPTTSDDYGNGLRLGGTGQDWRDMQRLGKKQQFKRNFSLWSALGFVAIYMATWEFVLVSLSVGFTNGGFAGLFWCFITTTAAYSTSKFTSGVLYNARATWDIRQMVNWFRKKFPNRPLYGLGFSLGANMLTTYCGEEGPNCQLRAAVVCSNPFNLELANKSLQRTLLGKEVYQRVMGTNMRNLIVGHKDSLSKFTDLDYERIEKATYIYEFDREVHIVHIAEEVENASIVVPRAMVWSYVGNVFFGFIMLITMLFCIGPIEDVIESDWPFIVLFDRTGSSGLNLFFNILLWVLIYLGNITALATCARETWAFARDKGLPFSGFIGHMDNKWKIPFNSVIGCVLLKRIKHEPLPQARWSLGRYGLAINGFAFLYSGFIIVFCCFPLSLPVGVADANWAPLIWAAVIALATVMYFVQGRKTYTAPVDFVEGRKAEGVELQQST
ncbi:hypothetical protein BN1723_008524 [Verticillium longisporum]|uniref:AB hydrolase-1 domain-containing protein n=1 Tax=Verticillium longisporum TaxID=100787 RepID=A0A0G4KGF5_VERLO|nr:hypothetical protein BN1723_008524 [Verticillium longisporum]